MKNYAYLLFVDELKNHNKYYKIMLNEDDSIDVEYARVGATVRKKHYERYEKTFGELYDEKIRKGYEDYTSLHQVVEKRNAEEYSDFKPIADTKVDELVKFLYNSSREFFRQNYTIKNTEINEKMVKEAEHDLELLTNCAAENFSVYNFNERLKALFADIPRKMTKVSDYMAQTSDDFNKIIERERDMLDNVKGQIIKNKVHDVKKISDTTYIEGFGLSVERPTYQEEDKIIANLGIDYDGKELEERYITCYKVKNDLTQKAYDEFVSKHNLHDKDIRHFYHGSKVENWLSIAKQGLLLNPDAKVTGKMFGQGLYFAGEKELRKSLNYMDVKGAVWNDGSRNSGFVAVYKVALGKCYKPSSSLASNFNYRSLKGGCLSVYADRNKTGLRNDEYIIYRQEQCTIEYLIEMRAFSKTLNFSIDRKAVRNDIADGFSTLIKKRGGFRAELDIDRLSERCRNELEKHIDFFEYEHVYIDYNAKKNTIEISVIDYNGDSLDIYSDFTNNDLSFLMREMKKAFVKSEVEWESLIEKGSKTKIGREVACREPKEKEPDRI